MSNPTERFDNSDLQMKDTQATGIYDNESEARQLKLYLQNLQLMSNLSASGDTLAIKGEGGKELKVPVKELVPFRSQFERYRLLAIAHLNNDTESELQRKLAKYEAGSVFELASKIANFYIDAERKQREKSSVGMYFTNLPSPATAAAAATAATTPSGTGSGGSR